MADIQITALPDRLARRELWWWALIAVLSLALAGILALSLAISRIPGIDEVFPWPLDFFQKGLIVHVVLSIVVWYLAVMGGLTHIVTLFVSGSVSAKPLRLASWGRLGTMAVGIGTLLLLFPALTDRGEPTLNNYIPVIIDPVYYTGLVLIGVGAALGVIRLLVNLWGLGGEARGNLDPMATLAGASGITYLVALVFVGISIWLLTGTPLSHDYNEDLFWGAGHVLQFLNVGLLLVAWSVLGKSIAGDPIAGDPIVSPPIVGPPIVGRGWSLAVAVMLVAPVLYGFYAYAAFEMEGAALRDSFSDLKYALGAPAVVFAALAIGELRSRSVTIQWRDPAFMAFSLSMVVFAVGGLLGFFVDGADTRTPAHYHGSLGGVNLAFMGVFFVWFLPLLGCDAKPGRSVIVLIWLYAAGQTLQSLGLFLAGGYGVPRKTAGSAQGLEDMGAIAGMYLNGIGALIAVIGGVMFIWIVGRALLGSKHSDD